VADNGAYAITLKSGIVKDTSGNAAARRALGSLTVAVPVPPTAKVKAGNLLKATSNKYRFTVVYSGVVPIDGGTLGSSDLKITGPNSFSQLATLLSKSVNATTGAITAVYAVSPPNGKWTSLANGTYKVVALAGEVKDENGTALPAGKIGSFLVAIT
jgi:hypothetical protein